MRRHGQACVDSRRTKTTPLEDDAALTQQIDYSRELARKAIHLVCLVIPIAVLSAPRQTVLALLVPATIAYAGADLLRLKWRSLNAVFQTFGGIVFRPHEEKRLTGATCMLTAAVASILLFAREVAALSLLFLILGDTAAAIVGRRFGRTRVFGKTLEGSMACLAACMLSLLAVPAVGYPAGAVGAITATLIEVLPIPLDDNLSLPLVSGFAMQMIL